MSGFHFSSVNQAITSENPSDSINLFWNQQMEKNKANASLFLTPNFDPTIGFEYPEFGTFGNNLLNPMLAIQQTMQSFQNGSWMNGMNNFGGFGNFGNFGGFGNFGFGSPWGNFQSPWGNNQAGTGNTAADKEYNKLKKALTEYKKAAEAMGDNELVDKINSALNKSGKVDEKLSAIKELCKSLDPTKMQNALLATDPYKADLIKIGYKVRNNDADKDLQRRIEAAYTEIDTAGTVNKLCANVLSGEDDPEILKILSFWNDKHNKTSDKSILRAIAPKIPSAKGDRTDYKKVVDCVTNSLISYSVRVKQNYDGTDFTNLDKSVDEVTKALKVVTDNFNKDNVDGLANSVNKLADKVEDLYARLRLIEAERVRNNIQKDYNFVNNYFTNKSVVNDNLVVSETKKDLTSEEIKIPTNTDVIPTNRQEVAPSTDLDNKPVDEQISELTTNSKDLHERATKKGKVYYSNKYNNEPAQWYMKDGDKLVQLKGVTSIDANGKCTMKSGAPTDLDKLSEDNKVEVLPSEIKAYNQALKQIKDYSGRLVKCPTPLQSWKNAGVTLYWSKGTINGEDGKPHCQCFVVIDNKLQKIDNAYVDKQGVIRFFNGETLDVKDLTSAHCTPVTSIDEIQLTNEGTTTGTVTGNGGSATLDGTGEMDELAEKLGLTETGVIGYYKKGRAYYKYNEETQQFEYLKGVTTINDNGTMVKNGHKEAIREVEKPEEAGKILRKKLGGDTSTEAYTVIAKKMNSFSTYTDLEDIARFFEAYEEERPWYALINSKMCAQIATEDDLDSATKGKYLKTIVKQTLVLAKKCLHRDSEEIDKLKEYSTESLEKSPFEIASIYTDRIRVIDSIIETVLKKYREKFPKDATANDTKAE